jgi:hypothetical protein
MSIKITGKLINVFKKPIVIDRDTKKEKPQDYAIQVLSEVNLRNSTETKNELIDIKIKDETSFLKYKSMLGKEVAIKVSTFSKSPIYLSEI